MKINKLLILCSRVLIIFSISLSIFALNVYDTFNGKEIYGFPIDKVDKLLNDKPPTVIDKEVSVPNVDKNNYVSFASYWWPNPSTANGLPYIRKDGKRNHKLVKQGDSHRFHKMAQSVVLLTRTYQSTGDSKYAQKAVEFLKAWFITPETRMNPNLDHGQLIMGKNEGTKSGILEMRYNISLVEVLPTLARSQYLTDEDYQAIKSWYTEYYTWLISSKIGRQAATRFMNNHGTWYDAQVVSIALFLGRNEFADFILENAKKRRVKKQIQPDGKQPMELKRTRSMTYTLFNLEALFVLTRLAEKRKMDLWNYETKDGRSIKQAYTYVKGYKDGATPWPTKQIDEVEQWRWQTLDARDDILLNIFR